ncbi:MAG: DUF4870 domain-containing protein [Archaeoglobaceae archaeon]
MVKTSFLGLDENIAGALTYVLGWLTGVIFYLLEKESRYVRFHAVQSIALFLPLHVVIIVLGYIPFIGWVISNLLALLGLVLWIVLIVKAYQGEWFKLPVTGDIAEERS